MAESREGRMGKVEVRKVKRQQMARAHKASWSILGP